MKKILFSILFLCMTIVSFAQGRTITGLVTDVANEPVIGATVRVPGTSVGAITDVDGTFSIDVPAGANEISVSYIGMPEPKIVEITSDYLEVNIGDQSIAVEDVIVTGYTTQQRRNFTGSAKTVGDGVVEDKSTADISEALAGEVAGVQVINSNGQPGTEATIRIRGFSSVNGNRNPLYVVDGAPYLGDIASINPADVESTTVLKDAAATAIYGSRGSAGVIVITTKKGKKGQSNINVDYKQGTNFRALPYYSRIESPEEYMEIAWEGMVNAYGSTEEANNALFSSSGINPYYNIWDTEGQYLINPSTGKFYENVNRKYTPERRRDEFFNNSDRREVNVSFSGGESKTTYNTSFGFLDDKGYFLASEFERLTGRIRVTHEVKPWLKGDMNLGYGNTKSDFSGQSGASSVNGFYLERMAPPIYGIYERNPDGTTVMDPIFGGPMYDFGRGRRGFSPLSNIAAVNKYDTDFSKQANLNGQGQLVATFLKDFDFTARFNYQYWEEDGDFRTNPYYGQAEGVGDLGKRKREINAYTFLQMLSWNKELGDHNINVYAAHENNDYEYKTQYNSGTGLIDPFGVELSNLIVQNPGSSSITDYNLESYFAMADYDFKGKYFLNAGIRRDGSSRFSRDNRWGTFPFVGVGWVASEEDWLSVDWLDFLKFKASYGVTGDQLGAGTYSGGGNTYSLSSVSGSIPALPFSSAVDPTLTWEKVNQADIGFEFDVLDRISGEFDFYRKETTDLFFNRRFGPSAGVALIRVNDGEFLNQGFEFDLNTKIFDKNDFKVEWNINGATLRNELTKSPLDPSTGERRPISDEGLFGYAEGNSIFDYYMHEFAGVNPDNGRSQWTQYYDDMNSNGAFDSGEEIIDLLSYKSNNPNANVGKTITEEYSNATQFYTGQSAIGDINGGTRLKVGYKGISLTGQMLYSFGGYGYDGNYQALLDNEVVGNGNWHSDIRNRWQNPGDVTGIPALTNGQGATAGNQNATSTRFLTKKDYLILNNLRLNYQLPERFFQKVGLEGASVWVSGDNLWSRSERDGFFPWVSEVGVTNRENYDPLSTATMGIQFKF